MRAAAGRARRGRRRGRCPSRRLPDTSRTGWWILIGLIPIIGWIVLIVFYVQDSHGDNEYGPSPKALQAPAV